MKEMGMTKSVAALFVLLFIPSLTFGNGKAGEIGPPAIMHSAIEGYVGPTLWVSARAAAAERDILHFDLIGEPAASSLGRLIEQQRRGRVFAESSVQKPVIQQIADSACHSTTLSTSDIGGGSQPSQTFGDLLQNALGIYSGRIVGIEPGFMAGVPASLLKVEVEDVLRSTDEYAPDVLYILYPFARFSIGGYTFCGGLSASLFDAKLGDRILVFPYTGSVSQEAQLAAPRREQMFFESSTREFFVPPALRDDPALRGVTSLDEIAQRVRG
jgi:hypothetical protein